MNKLIFLFFLSTLSSCVSECKLVPIDEKIFDINQIEKKYILANNLNETDSLIYINHTDKYQKKYRQSFINFVECEHFKSYELKFRDEIIEISLRKNKNGELTLNLLFACGKILDERKVGFKEMIDGKEYKFNRRKDCEINNSEIKTIILNGIKVKSIETTDNKIWKADI